MKKSCIERYVLLALLALGTREIEKGDFQDADEVFAALDRDDAIDEGAGSRSVQDQGERTLEDSQVARQPCTTKMWVRPG